MANDEKITKYTIDASGAAKGAQEAKQANEAIQQAENKTAQNVEQSSSRQTTARRKASADLSQTTQANVAAYGREADAFAKSTSTDRRVVSMSSFQRKAEAAARRADPIATRAETADTTVSVLEAAVRNPRSAEEAERYAQRLVAAYKMQAEAHAAVALAAKDGIQTNGVLAKTYDDLTVAARNFERVQAEGRAAAQLGGVKQAASLAQTPEITQAKGLAGQLDAQRQGKIVDLVAIKDAQELTEKINGNTKALQAMHAEAQKIRDDLDPLAKLQRDYNAEVDRYLVLRKDSQISDDQYLAKAVQAFEKQKQGVEALGAAAQTAVAQISKAISSVQQAHPAGAVLPAGVQEQIAKAQALEKQISSAKPGTVSQADLKATQDQTKNLLELADAEKRAAEGAKRLAVDAQKLREQFDPLGAALRRFDDEVAHAKELLVAKAIDPDIYDKAFRAAAAKFTETANTIKAAAQNAVDSLTNAAAAAPSSSSAKAGQATALAAKIQSQPADQVSQAELTSADRIIKELKDETSAYNTLANSAQKYLEKVNPLLEIQRRYQAEITKITEIQKASLDPQGRLNALLADYTQKLGAVSKASAQANADKLTGQEIQKKESSLIRQAQKDFFDFGSTANRAFGLNRVGLLELQAAGINAVQALSAGISPLRVLETEATQVIGAIIQGTSLTFKQFAAFGAPIAVVTAALVAFGAAVVGAAGRVQQIRELNVALSTFHSTSSTTAQDLQNIAKEFKYSGVSASTANGLIAQIARNPTLNPAFTKNIIANSQNIGAAFGTDLSDGFKRLEAALNGGADGIINLGFELGVIDSKEAAQILRLNNTVGAQAAVQKGYELITGRLRDYRESLSPTGKLLESITGLWNVFWDSIKDSAPFQGAVNLVERLTKKIDELKEKLKAEQGSETTPVRNAVAGGVIGGATGFIAGAGTGGIAGASIGSVGGPLGSIVGGGVGALVGGALGTALGAAIGASIAGAWQDVVQAIKAIKDKSISSVKDAVMVAVNNATEVLTKPIENVKHFFTEAKSNIESFITSFSGIGTVVTDAISKVGSLFSFATDGWNKFWNMLPDSVRGVVPNAPAVPGYPNSEGVNIGGKAGPGPTAPGSAGIAPPETPSSTNYAANFRVAPNVRLTGQVPNLADIFSHAAETLPAGWNLTLTSGGRPHGSRSRVGMGSAHVPGEAVDYQISDPAGKAYPNIGDDTTGYYAKTFNAARAYQQSAYPQYNPYFRTGATFGANGGPISATSPADIGHADVKGFGIGRPVAPAAITPTGTVTEKSNEQKKAEADLNEEIRHRQELLKSLLPAQQQFGVIQEAMTAQITAEADALKRTGDASLARQYGQIAYNEVLQRAQTELTKQNQVQDEANKLGLETARITGTDEVGGLRAAAQAQAALAKMQNPIIDQQQRMNQLLADGAVEAINASAKAIPGLILQTKANRDLADAAAKGTAAEHEQALQNQATVATHDAVAKAQATGNQKYIEAAQALHALTLAQIKANDTAQTALELRRAENTIRDNIALMQLEVQLQGKTSEEIATQVSLLRAKQELLAKGKDLTEEESKKYLEIVAAQGRENELLGEARRAQERVNDLVRGIADTIQNELSQSLSDAFDGKKAEDWGTRMKRILKSLLTQITEFAFIRPLIGTALGVLGFGSVAQQYGTFGGLLGGGGGVAGASGASGVSGAAGLASIFGAGGFSGFLNNTIGSKLGFANTVGAAAEGSPFSATIAGPGVPSGLGVTGGAGIDASGLFGATTLSQGLGGVAAGFGAGALTNTLLGGNQTNGLIGSGVGAVAGTVLGSILLPGIGSILGGLAGGALGGAGGGLLGPAKSTMASGENVNLATGKISGFTSSGNQQNDQTSKQIGQSLSAFTTSLQKLTKGTVDGLLNVTATTKGIETHYAGSLGKIDAKFDDAESAINGLELALAKNLKGVSGSLKTILDNLTDPAQIQDAVTFAATYDDLKKAADSAFSSISTDNKQIGAFEQALGQLNTTFQDLTDKATQFGLSLDPINAGLAEATKRLQQDFGKALDQALDSANSTEFITQLGAVSQAFKTNTRDAKAIGLGNDAGTTMKIAELERAQAAQVLLPLTVEQLSKVVDAFADTNPEIALMAQHLIDLGGAAEDLGGAAKDANDAVKTLAEGIKALEDLALSLKTGELSGLTPAKAAENAASAYQQQLSDVSGSLNATGGVSGQQLADLARLGQAAIEASRTAWGQAPQTADLRRQIVADLDQITSKTGASAVAAAAAAAAAAATAEKNKAAVVATQPVQDAQAAAAAAVATQPVQDAQLAAAAAAIADAETKDLTVAATTQPAVAAAAAVDTSAAATADTNPIQSVLGFASGTTRTPPGPILVGEKGPEWMSANDNGWVQVGKSGPEIIDQPGGAMILPFPHTPMTMRDRAFADGTALDDIKMAIGDINTISDLAGGPTILGTLGDLTGVGDAVGGIGDTIGGALGFATSEGPGAIFGAATLGATSTAAGLGGIVGGLINRFIGKNTVAGSIGSSVLSFGGAALAILAGFNPLLGGLIGGILGGLLGLIGPKPANKESGDLINLADGSVSDWHSSGVSQNDEVVQKISSGISSFTTAIQAATGGKIQGYLGVQAGSRDGIKTSYEGPLGHIDAKFGSASEAFEKLSLAIAQNLTDLDPEVQAALSQITDIRQIADVLQALAASKAAALMAAAGEGPEAVVAAGEGPEAVQPKPITDIEWWEKTGAKVTPYIPGSVPSPSAKAIRGGAPIYWGDEPIDSYEITQPSGGPSYLAYYMTETNAEWWRSQNAAVAPGTNLPVATEGHSLYTIVQQEGPSYVGALADSVVSAHAMGTQGTSPGRILVGERGPEWMHGEKGWGLVGRGGPEIIDQPGGAIILPFPVQPDKQYADGTPGWRDALESMQTPELRLPTISMSSDNQNAIVTELRGIRANEEADREERVALRKAVDALQKQVRGGQVQASEDASIGNSHLSQINSKVGSGTAPVQRREVA